jgi:hypothetical protein
LRAIRSPSTTTSSAWMRGDPLDRTNPEFSQHLRLRVS